MSNLTGQSSTNITTHLIIINCLLLAAASILEKRGIDLNSLLGLHYIGSDNYHWWQSITYMFMHGNFTHLFNNMFSLYMFGRLLEMVWGEKRFLVYYLFTGIGAAVIQQLAWRYDIVGFIASCSTNPTEVAQMSYAEALQIPGAGMLLNQLVTVGASGSVFGILLAFGMLFPNATIYLLIPPMPMKAKWLVVIYGIFELFAGVWGIQTGVAHFAHLGGMLFGFILIQFWKKHRNYNFD